MLMCISSFNALAPVHRPLGRSTWLKMAHDDQYTSSELSRRSVFAFPGAIAFAGISLLDPSGVWAVDLNKLEISEEQQLSQLSAQEDSAKQMVDAERDAAEKEKKVLKNDYDEYAKDVLEIEKLEKKENKLTKKLTKEGKNLNEKELAKLKVVESDILAAKDRASKEEATLNKDRELLKSRLNEEIKSEKKLKALKADETEVKQAIEEAEILKKEEEEILGVGGNLNSVDAAAAIMKGIGEK